MTATTTVPAVTLDDDLAKKLARVSSRVDTAVEERDRMILVAFATGASLRDIGEIVGMTHTGVKKLVERRQADFVLVNQDGEVISIIEAKRSTKPLAEGLDILESYRIRPTEEQPDASE